MTMSYLKKLAAEDAIKILADKLSDASKTMERIAQLGPEALLELDWLAALCRTYALDAAQEEITALGDTGPICELAGGLYLGAEAIEEFLDGCMEDEYPEAGSYMAGVLAGWDAEQALCDLDCALREARLLEDAPEEVKEAMDNLVAALQEAGLLEDGEDLHAYVVYDDEEPEIDAGERPIAYDEQVVEAVLAAKAALVDAGLMEEGQGLILTAGEADEDDDEDADDIIQALKAVQAGLGSLGEALYEAGLLEEGENLQLTILSPGEDLEIDESQRLVCCDDKMEDHAEALKDILVDAGLVTSDCEVALLAGPGDGCEDCGEDGPEIELVDMADLEDEEAEAVKTMAGLLVAAGMMDPDQDICIAKVGVPPVEDGRPYASLYVGDDTALIVTPG